MDAEHIQRVVVPELPVVGIEADLVDEPLLNPLLPCDIEPAELLPAMVAGVERLIGEFEKTLEIIEKQIENYEHSSRDKK